MEAAPSRPRNEWIQRFSLRLRELQQVICDEQSKDVALAAFPTSNDLEPEDAAAVFSEILDARVPANELKRWVK